MESEQERALLCILRDKANWSPPFSAAAVIPPWFHLGATNPQSAYQLPGFFTGVQVKHTEWKSLNLNYWGAFKTWMWFLYWIISQAAPSYHQPQVNGLTRESLPTPPSAFAMQPKEKDGHDKVIIILSCSAEKVKHIKNCLCALLYVDVTDTSNAFCFQHFIFHKTCRCVLSFKVREDKLKLELQQKIQMRKEKMSTPAQRTCKVQKNISINICGCLCEI